MGFQQSFKALSDPVRREILSLLRRGPMAAGDIAAHRIAECLKALLKPAGCGSGAG